MQGIKVVVSKRIELIICLKFCIIHACLSLYINKTCILWNMVVKCGDACTVSLSKTL